jgi:GWxTD domain-containing protein
MMLNGRKIVFAALGSGLVLVPALMQRSVALAQSQPQAQQQSNGTTTESNDQNFDPRKRQRGPKERYKAQKELRQELKGTYKTWLNQDASYIISDEERKAFSHLSNDEERDAFIEAFWQRRNPNPDSPENEFREEHYRRIQYANEHYAAGKPGWKTDRGRIYISWGKPDNIDSHPSGGTYERTPEEGGGSTSTFPFEVWHYRYLEGVGENVDIEFVDTCQCGDYHFTIDRSEKDALLHVPGAGLTQYEEMNHKDKSERFKGNGLENLGGGPMGDYAAGKEFDRIELAAKLFAPPPVKFKDLEAFVTEHKVLTGPIFPFDVRTDYVKVTENMDTVPITVQLKMRDITFVTKDGVSKGVVNILGKVTTLAHKTVQTFEDTVEVSQPAELLEKVRDQQRVYWKALPLTPGLYRLDIAIKDVNNPDHIGIYGRGIEVPTFHDEKLGTSSLILADQMRTVSSREIGNGNFILGNTFVRPRVSDTPAAPVKFKRTQDFNFWMQVYNLGIDEATKSNQAMVTYQILDAGSGAVLFEKQVSSKDLGEEHSDQLTVAKNLPIAGLQPGKYKVSIKVNDAISKQEIAQSAPFVVE